MCPSSTTNGGTTTSGTRKKVPAKDPKTGKVWKSTPTTMDATECLKYKKFMCYYQLGDTTPYYIETMGWEKTIGRLKERILETRGQAHNLHGVTDISMYKIYPPGKCPHTGKPLHPELDDMEAPIPTHSTFENPILVPAVRNEEEDAKQAANVQELVRQRMLARKRKSKKAAEPEQPATITVQVQTPDGTTIPVTLMPTRDTIQSIKDKIAPDVGVDASEQVLTFNDQELTNNDDTAEAAGLKDGSILQLQPNSILVQVKTPNGTMIPVTIHPSDTIQSIKETIAPQAGIEPNNQVLKFDNTTLDNDATADASGLKNGSVIDLSPHDITVHVQTPEGETICSITICPYCKMHSIKEIVAGDTGVEPDKQVLTLDGKDVSSPDQSLEDAGLVDGSVIHLQPNPITVQVKTPDGTMIPVSLLPSDSIQSIKEQVAPESGLEPSQQVMTFDGKPLQDGDTAKDSGLKDGSVIDLAPKVVVAKVTAPKDITVHVETPEGKTISITVCPYCKMQAIKEIVAGDTGVEPGKQKLTFDGRDVSSPDKSLEDAGLKDGSIIHLQPNTITVQVKTPDGKTIPVTIDPEANIQSIKETIAPDVGMDAAKQVLTLDGNELANDKSANASGLKDGSVIELAPNTLSVQVKTPNGTLIPVTIDPSDTIQSIKETIAPDAGIEPNNQVMKFNNQKLANGDTAEASGLKDGSVIDLSPHDITVHIKTPEDKTISITVCPYCKMQAIKEIVAGDTGVEPDKQVLTFNGKDVSNNDTSLEDAGLVDGSVIHLQPNPITVQVKTPDGTMIPVSLLPSDNVQSIKEQIAPTVGVDVADQILKFNNQELPNDQSAKAVGLQDGSVIELLKPEPTDIITIQVKTPDGKMIPVQMKLSDTIESVKEKVEPEAGIEAPVQVLKFQGKKLKGSSTGEEAGLSDGSVLDLEINKKEAKKQKMKKLKDKADGRGWKEQEPKDYRQDFTPTPLDLSRLRTHFMVGDQVPMVMIAPIGWTIRDFKLQVLKMKQDTSFVMKYLHQLNDPDGLDVFPPGSNGEGDPLPDDILVPRTSTEYDTFSVMRREGF